MSHKAKDSGENGLGISARAFQRAVADNPRAHFVLKLYISGMTPRSRRAIDNLQKLCAEHLMGGYDLEIVDIYQQPGLAKGAQIIAAPTLVKTLPLPLRRVIGDLSDPGRILLVLGVMPAAAGRASP
ncbi:MAG: circadian clock KaiB family protein [Pseudomonadota bacterium]|nr:circadian clock KaiB family protein [Pseudomonadota bacterium]